MFLRPLLSIAVIFIYSSYCAQNNTDSTNTAAVIIEGNYEGNNVYVQNPYASDSGFCTLRITVNGSEIPFENSSAYEINLKNLNLKLGDKIEIKIYHKPDCRPKIINNGPGSRKSTFEIVLIQLSEDGTLKWTSKNENAKLLFIVEQFRWNKWIKTGEVDGKGGLKENEYAFAVPLHSGENNVRVKQVDYKNLPRASQPVRVYSKKTKPGLQINKEKKQIEFSDSTLYELYDVGGNLLKKGSSNKINCSDLKPGKYFMNYDNTSDTIELWK